MTKSLSAIPRRCAVLGHPISHSLSPFMHRAAYAHLGLDWNYDALDVDEGGLERFVNSRDSSWRGLSLTMPLKVRAVDLATDVEPLARQLESVNTLVFEGDQIRGYNTDVTGLRQVIRPLLAEQIGAPELVVVLGAGATARSALAALATEGQPLVTVCARRSEAITPLVTLGSQLGIVVETGPWPPHHLGPANLRGNPLVVSTLPLPAAEELVDQISPHGGVLVDVLYDPWPSPLAQKWLASGARAIGGVDMLVHQGVAQVELMTGRVVPDHVLRDAAMGELVRRNIAQAEQ